MNVRKGILLLCTVLCILCKGQTVQAQELPQYKNYEGFEYSYSSSKDCIWIMEYVGDKIKLVNPAYETAMDLKALLQENDLENPDVEGDHGSYSFYVSDAADKFKQFANSILPYDIETTKQINIEEY